MTRRRRDLFLAMLGLVATVTAVALPVPEALSPVSPIALSLPEAKLDTQSQPLFDFEEPAIKFRLETLMALLRDRRHEGWVLAAYPDPKTRRPLIGAGFSLDVQAIDHPQPDILNPHRFVEPSSEQLWHAAGLSPQRLETILRQFERRQTLNGGRRKAIRIRSLAPQVTDEEAMRLLRISAIQAISNARAYCRNFDQLTASQQMALSQLVFQMGVNLEEFQQFLGTLNSGFFSLALPQSSPMSDASELLTREPLKGDEWSQEHWINVQDTLIDSQWARLYSDRASSVIAMFDPRYESDEFGARQRVERVLLPTAAVSRRPGSRFGSGSASKAQLRTASLRTTKAATASHRAALSSSRNARHRRKLG